MHIIWYAFFYRLLVWVGLLGIIGLGISWQAFAQGQLLSNPLAASDEPVSISADQGIEWNRDQKYYMARGNAQASQGQFYIAADQLQAFYNEKKSGGGQPDVWKVVARGNVYARSGSDELFGEEVEYLLKQQQAIISGDLIILETEQGRISTQRDPRSGVAPKLTYDGLALRAEAVGDTLVSQNKNVVRAERLIAYLFKTTEAGSEKTKLRKVEAQGRVRLTDGSSYAECDRADYDPIRQIAICCGNVKVSQGTNQLVGGYAQLNLGSGQSTIRATGCQGEPAPQNSGRVFILIDPKSGTTQFTTPN